MDYSVNFNMPGMNPMKDFTKTTQDSLKGLNIGTGKGDATLKGYISENQIDLNEDQELVNDLNTLIGKNNSGSNDMSAGKVAKSFSNVIGNYVNDVNNTQRGAEKAVETFASGGNIDVHSVMIASEKANLSMQMTMQMRNKFLQAYQEISRMQV